MIEETIPKGKILFEVSWEVCNKVGGIYSVISTKVPYLKDKYEEYYCIGPYFKDKAAEDFQEEEPPEKFKDTFESIKHKGIIPHFGTWLIKGEPKTILIEFNGISLEKDVIKKKIWEKFRVESLFSRWDFEEPMLFSFATGRLLKMLEDHQKIDATKTILHAHEWLTGFTILKLKIENSKISTVFTTHATMLGRSISSNSQNLYSSLGKFDPKQKAQEMGVIDKFSAEKASANVADIFTTVSEITAREAEYILGRKPEVLTLNGMDMSGFPSIQETSIKHVTSKQALEEFLIYTFFPYYKFDLSNTLCFYLAGRYEYSNKGIDIFIEALGKLNQELKRTNSDKTIIAFFFIAMPNKGAKVELLENKNYYRHINNYVQSKSDELMNKIVIDFLRDEDPSCTLFNKDFIHEMKRDVLRFKRHGKPMLCTHRLFEQEENNTILKAFKQTGFENHESDKVKTILFPAYLDGSDMLLNLEFYDTIAGCNLGIFPSYYEPWGYTPMESGAVGVPAITTDLAGFGRFIKRNKEKEKNEYEGIYVLEREAKTREEIIEQLYKTMLEYSLMEHDVMVENKVRAKELAHQADWKSLVHNYIDAHNLAIMKNPN